MTTLNNYDTSSTGHDIEILAFCDTYMAQMDFEDNFKRLDKDRGRNATPIYFFGEGDPPADASDLFDWSDVTEQGARAWLWGQYKDSYSSQDLQNARDMIEECRECHGGSWRDMAQDWMAGGGPCFVDYSITENMLNDAEFIASVLGAPLRYRDISVTGYSQGDYSRVLVDPSGWGEKANFSDIFERYLYAAPVCARLDIDGEEYYLEEALSDNYYWDADEVRDYIRGLDIPSEVKTQASEMIPDYIDCL